MPSLLGFPRRRLRNALRQPGRNAQGHLYIPKRTILKPSERKARLLYSEGMSGPVLATKLYSPPPRANAVARPRLLERLDAGVHRKLTLVSAPAGFGKTTIVNDWLAWCGRPAAWLSLDKNDSTPTRFVTYLIAALQTAEPRLSAGVLAELQSPQPPPTEALLSTLLNEVSALPDKLVLVLDDYHLIDAQAVDTALSFFLEHLPPNLHLVITTREDPQLPLARLRARDQLTELRANDLRFSDPETAAFLNRGMNLELSAEDISALEARTEGWIAGLQLAALSVQSRDDVSGFVTAFAGDNRYIADYLVEEVLLQQGEPVRAFLLQTSILERLSGPLCDAVTGQTGAQEMLETLEHSNLFVIPLDDKRRWYRYHHLFADVLQTYLIKEQPQQPSALHKRASAWYEQNDLGPEAIHHALAANDFERAAGLIELSWRTMDVTFQSATWLGWVKQVPEDLVRTRPVLSVGYAWALLNTGEFGAMEPWLRVAEGWLDGSVDKARSPEMVVVDEEEFQALPVTIASARAYKAQALGDVPATIRHTSRALEHLPEDDVLGRAIPLALLGLAYWASGELEVAYQSLAEGMAGFEATGQTMAAISGTFGLADMRLGQGRLREAFSVYERSLNLVAAHGGPAPRGTALLYLGLSELCRERGDLEASAKNFQKSEEAGKHDTQDVYHYRHHLALAQQKEDRGDLEGALESLEEATSYQRKLHVPFVHPVAALKARVWLKQGNLNEALAWVRERGLSVHDELSYLHEFEHITLARVLVAKDEDRAGEEALGLLARLLKAAEAGKRQGSVIEISVVQALAHRARGDVSAALASLGRALTLAEPEGYIRTFVNEGLPMARLLTEAAKQRIMPDYTHRLLAAFEAKKENTHPNPQTLPPLLEPLSERELEVLRLVAQGLSNRDISKRLFRALDTVKGHNRRIYGKLQVRNRTEAVARARELGLL